MTQSYDFFSGYHTNHQFPSMLITSMSVFILQLDIVTNNVSILDQKNALLPLSELLPQSCLPFQS